MKKFLFALAATACTMLGSAQSAQQTTRDVTFVITTDLHFDFSPEADKLNHIATINRLENNFTFPASSLFAGEKIKKIDGVAIAGDILGEGGLEPIAKYRKRYEQGNGEQSIHYPVYPGYGNHDIDPLYSDSVKNLAGRKLALAYMDSILQDKLTKKEILNLHPSSRSYSWNVGDVHFVQAHRFSGDTGYCESNLDWLADDLKQYASNGNPVVYIQHYGVDKWAIKWWPQAERNRLFDTLDQYNIAAFLVGHSHAPSLQRYRGYPIYQINNVFADKDGNGSFAVLRIKDNQVSISGCRWTDDKGNFETTAPYVNETLPRKINRGVHYNAFSHNDYTRENPVFDALSFRFNCIEADLWLIDGELYVSHDKPVPSPAITFENLYLKPLAAYLKAHRGKVYPESHRQFYLMVDCKTNGEAMYPILKQKMEPYQNLCCSIENGVYKEGAILFFLSGDRPRKSLESETTRFTFLDGRVEDLGKGIPNTLIPVVSDDYGKHITWRGKGEMPADQLQKMRAIIKQAHSEGKLFRWWGAPDNEQFKRFFIEEGVDLVGADDLNILYNVLQ